MSISTDVAEFAALVSEGIFYGMFLNLSVVAAYFYVTQKRRRRILAPMIITVILMILLTTAKIVVDGRTVMVAFLNYETRAERIAFLTDVLKPLNAIRNAMTGCLPLIDNVFMTYRCYIILSGQKSLVSIPLLFTLASAACTIGGLYSLQNPAKFSVHVQQNWVVATFVLFLAAHAAAIFLTAFRIYRAEQENQLIDSQIPSYMPIIWIVVESGIMNTSLTLLVIITFTIGSNTVTIFLGMAAPLEGITFIIVFIRAAINSQHQAVQKMAVVSNSNT